MNNKYMGCDLVMDVLISYKIYQFTRTEPKMVMQLKMINVDVYSSAPGWNDRHFADDIFKCIFVNEIMCILSNISLKFTPKGPINNNPSLIR